jgi:hypothetical protein
MSEIDFLPACVVDITVFVQNYCIVCIVLEGIWVFWISTISNNCVWQP